MCLGISSMVRAACLGALFGHRKRFGAFFRIEFGTGSKQFQMTLTTQD
jgi:hypothetical protein